MSKLKQKIKGIVGSGKLQEFSKRDWQEDGRGYAEAQREQERLKYKRRNRNKMYTNWKQNVSKQSRKEWGERMNHLRSI